MKKNFLSGIVTLLPIVLFVVVFMWLANLVLGWVGRITSLFPQSMWDAMGLSETIVNVLGFIILCSIVWFVGFIMNQRKMGQKLKDWFNPIISKVPLLSSLSKITNQVTNTLTDTNSFQKVVLVRSLTFDGWFVGFITGEDTDAFGSVVGKKLVSVFIPTTPNPTSGLLLLMDPRSLEETKASVATAISFIISMGTAGAAEEILKMSQETAGAAEEVMKESQETAGATNEVLKKSHPSSE